MYDRVISKNPSFRHTDGKMFISIAGEMHHGKACRVVKAVEPGEDGYDAAVGKSLVELEDETRVVVLNDEVRG